MVAAENAYNYAELSKLDIEFHRFIMQKTDTKRLFKAWKDIASQMHVLLRMIRYFEFSSAYMSMMHRELLEALRSGNCAECESSFRSHILLSEENILSVFRGSKQPQPDSAPRA